MNTSTCPSRDGNSKYPEMLVANRFTHHRHHRPDAPKVEKVGEVEEEAEEAEEAGEAEDYPLRPDQAYSPHTDELLILTSF
jgi:hypothetical protein